MNAKSFRATSTVTSGRTPACARAVVERGSARRPACMPFLLDSARGPRRLLLIAGTVLLVGGLYAFESSVGRHEVWTFDGSGLAYVKESLGSTRGEYARHAAALTAGYLEVGRSARLAGLLLLAAGTALGAWCTRSALAARATQAALLTLGLWILVLRAPAPEIPSLSLRGLPLLVAFGLLELAGRDPDEGPACSGRRAGASTRARSDP